MFGLALAAATHLGDAALLLPASAALFLVLFWRTPRMAALWAGVLVAGLSAMVAAKLLLHGCGPRVQSPSGHTAFSALFYGCAALVVMAGQREVARWLIAAGAIAVVAAVSVSRVRLGIHSPEEVLMGLAIGALGVVAFARLRPPLDRPVLTAPILAASLLALALVIGGRHVGIEHWVGHAARLAPALDVCA